MMNKIEYYLLPESGYTGDYDREEAHFKIKKGTVADLIHDSGMLWGADFDKVIPTIDRLNNMLLEGGYPRLAEWEPFSLNESEYDEMVQELLKMPLNKPYRVE